MMDPSSFVNTEEAIIPNASILKVPFLATGIHSGDTEASYNIGLPTVHFG